jgi:hypothetical protein
MSIHHISELHGKFCLGLCNKSERPSCGYTGILQLLMHSHFLKYAWSLGLLLNAEFDPNLLGLNVPFYILFWFSLQTTINE